MNDQSTELTLLPSLADRRRELDSRHELLTGLMAEAKIEGIIAFDPSNIAWLSGRPLCQGIVDPNDLPFIFFTPSGRWLACSNVDSQRLFDLHLDGLGFQLKEWPWHVGRERLITDLCNGRKVGTDRVVPDCLPMGPTMRRLRAVLSPVSQTLLFDLGQKVVHAVEATGRTLERGESESEIAGQLAHRLYRRGVTPTNLVVAAGNRLERHRRAGHGTQNIERSCVILATGSAHGLHVTTARTVSFGPADAILRETHNTACQVLAAQIDAGRPARPAINGLDAGRAIGEQLDREHEWRLAAPGWVTGWLAVERTIEPSATFPLQKDYAVVWQASVGPALAAETVLIGDPPGFVTPMEEWPVQRISVAGQPYDIPDILER